MKRTTEPLDPGPALPWWRYRMVWLVVAGPALVVVAAIVTAVIAMRGADPLVDESRATRDAGRPTADTPALKARNHAAAAGS